MKLKSPLMFMGFIFAGIMAALPNTAMAAFELPGLPTQCLPARYNSTHNPGNDVDSVNCTSNDVSLSVYVIEGGEQECTPGQKITVNLIGKFVGTSQTRYDVGAFIPVGDTTNPNALGGTCLNVALLPVSANNGDVNVDEQTPQNNVFYNGELGTGDQCGDLLQGVETFVYIPNVEITCVDTDAPGTPGYGTADLSTCTAWSNSIDKTNCLSTDYIAPETTAKCNCESVEIANLYVPECGNGTLDPGEECDDHNLIDGDGCSSTCEIEPCFEVDCSNSEFNTQCSFRTCDPEGEVGNCDTVNYEPATTSCTGSSNGGACDGNDSCDGNGGCTDGYLSATTVCRDSAGQCDVAESCTGSSGACPGDDKAAATTTCVGTSNGGPCDGNDSCDGNGGCTDGYLSATTVCRDSAGQCDVAESCTGSSGACPGDDKAAATTTCVGTSNGGQCDGPDSCNGEGDCVDGYLNGTTCNADNSVCTDDQCISGVCTAGEPDTCDDSDECTADYCDAELGCSNSHIPACGEGCTPGFWKANADNKGASAWEGTSYEPGQTVFSAFGNLPDNCKVKGQNAYNSLEGVTLQSALSFSGGPTITDAAKILLRAATAALLNSTSGCMTYALSTADILAQVQTALATCNRNQILALATQLDLYNNAYDANTLLHCPINQAGICTNP